MTGKVKIRYAERTLGKVNFFFSVILVWFYFQAVKYRKKEASAIYPDRFLQFGAY